MPEKFTLEGTLRQAPGIDADQGFVCAKGNAVQHLGYNLFAGAMFAGNQHVGIGRTNLGNGIHYRTHGRGRSNKDGASLSAEKPVLCFETLTLPPGLVELSVDADGHEQAFVIPWFLNEIPSTASHGFDGQINGAPRSHNNNGNLTVNVTDFLQEFNTFK